MDLRTTYLGLELAHPLMPGASPLVDDLDQTRRLEDAGASAIVLHSLFEEQVVAEELGALARWERTADAFPEALSYMPHPLSFPMGPDGYLELVRRTKEAVAVPVIASLNGVTPGGWVDHARWIEEAGADALELNTYFLATDLDEPGEAVERRTLDVLAAVRAATRLPIAVKLSPFYSALPHFVRRLQAGGAAGVVLFNRFYQPEVDPDALEVGRALRLSDPSELNLRLRWLAILSGRLPGLSLGCSGGVHGPLDAVKAVMTGAHAVQMVSALLRHGPERLREAVRGLAAWLEEREYESLRQLQGSMDLTRCPDPRAYERANYAHLLQSWR